MDNNHEQLFNRLFTDTFTPLFRFANARLNDAHRAEELVQDAFLIAVDKMDEVAASKNPEGWLMNTMKFLILHENRLRSKGAAIIFEYEQVNDYELASKDEYIAETRSMFSDEEWWLLRVSCIEKLPVGIIAKQMGLPYETCKKRVQKVKRIAAEKYDEYRKT